MGRAALRRGPSKLVGIAGPWVAAFRPPSACNVCAKGPPTSGVPSRTIVAEDAGLRRRKTRSAARVCLPARRSKWARRFKRVFGLCYRLRSMGILPDARARGSLGPYLACAAAVHAGFFALSPVRAAEAPGDIEAAAVVGSGNVDVEPMTSDPHATPPGGGSPIAGTPAVATARPPVPSAPPKPGSVAAKFPIGPGSSRAD